MEEKNDWHLLTDSETLDRLSVGIYRGLDEREAGRRRRRYGANRLWHVRHSTSVINIASSVFDIATLILIATAVCAALFDKSYEAGSLTAILVIGAVLRGITFVRANRILEDCAKSKIPVCSVIREGRVKIISAAELVPGDIVLLEAGDTVPCDGRVVSGSVSVVEKGITENKTPVKKFNSAIKLAPGSHDVPCEFRSNMLFAGSGVISGSVRIAATSTGEDTLISRKQGGIELETAEIPEIESLKARSRNVSLIMLACVLVLAVLSMLLGENNSLPGVFLSSMAMATAAMSEFLSVIGYIIFSVSIRDCGDKRWKNGHVAISSRAVIRNPESLGSIISCDRIVFCGSSYFKSGEAVIAAYRTSDGFSDIRDKSPEKDERLERLLGFARAATLSSNEGVTAGNEEIGSAECESLTSSACEAYTKATDGRIFSDFALADHRGHETEGSMGLETSLLLMDGDFYALSCGRIDDIMRCCSMVETKDGAVTLDHDTRKRIFTECARLEISGGRVAAVAKRQSQFQNLTRLPVLTQYMTFVGYFVIAEKEEKYARENIAFLKSRNITPILFSTSAQADYYYLSRLGLFSKDCKLIPAGDKDALNPLSGEAVISFDGMNEREYAAAAAEITRRLGGENTIALGRTVWDSGVLAEAEYGLSAAQSSMRTVPATLSRSSDAIIYPDNGGGLDGAVRVLKSSTRARRNIETAKFYLTASQCARLCVMLSSVIFGLPGMSAVFILIWGLLFDFGASLVMSFCGYGNDTDEREKSPLLSAVFGVIWGVLLSALLYLAMRLTGSAGESISIMSGGAIISALVLTEVILKPLGRGVPLGSVYSNADMLFTLCSAVLTSVLMLTQAGAKLISGEETALYALLSLIPAALMLLVYGVTMLIKRIRKRKK